MNHILEVIDLSVHDNWIAYNGPRYIIGMIDDSSYEVIWGITHVT